MDVEDTAAAVEAVEEAAVEVDTMVTEDVAIGYGGHNNAD